MKISVIGLGYIGLPTSIVLGLNGHTVYGYDISLDAVQTLNEGRIHIVEDKLQEAYEKVLDQGMFKAATVLIQADVYIIAVPTPFKNIANTKKADLSYVKSAAKSIAKVLKAGDLVILESTVPPGTTKIMTDILEETSGISRMKFHSVHCPERVLPGQILYELEHNDRIIGSERIESAIIAKDLYKSFVKVGNIFTTDDVTAEMAKLVENTYRDVNIAFANELSIISEKLNIDVFELISLANKHPRVNILTPGVGVGGHCLAVDPWFIVEQFPKEAKIIKNSRETNDLKPYWVSDKVNTILKEDKNKVIGILGLAYKPNIDDLRESPSIEMALNLKNMGYSVVGCEPNCEADFIEGIPNLNLSTVLKTADFIVLTLAHSEFEYAKSEIRLKPNFDCIGMLK